MSATLPGRLGRDELGTAYTAEREGIVGNVEYYGIPVEEFTRSRFSRSGRYSKASSTGGPLRRGW